eukprot:jgi/Hompol1/752/HPOL_000538-RA
MADTALSPHPDIPAWKTSWRNALDARDACELTPFTSLFAACNEMVAAARARSADIEQLEQQLASLKAVAAETSAQLAVAREQGNPDILKQLADHAAEIKTLKDERAELYRVNASNSQRVLTLLDESRERSDTIKSLSDRVEQLTAANKTLATKLSDRDELLKEKDHVIQILRDELATHQLELVQREEQLREKEKRVLELEMDNKTLLDRWMLQKQKEAAQMNEANEFVETALKTKASVQKRESLFGLFGSASPSSASPTDTSDALRRDGSHIKCILPRLSLHQTALHEGGINCIAISRDGSMVATGASDKKLIICDATTCTQKSTLTGSMQAIMSVTFNSAGDHVMGTSNDNSAKIWSISTSRLKAGIKTIFTLSSCNDLALLDGDGTMIASGHLDNNLRIWDTRSGNLIREVSGIHFGQITGVELSPNSNQVLTTSRDNTLKLFDFRTYNTISTFADDGFRTGMNWAKSCFSPDGAYVASGSADGAVYFWDTATAQTVLSLKEHKSPVCGVVWNPQGGSNVYSASEKDKYIVHWGLK